MLQTSNSTGKTNMIDTIHANEVDKYSSSSAAIPYDTVRLPAASQQRVLPPRPASPKTHQAANALKADAALCSSACGSSMKASSCLAQSSRQRGCAPMLLVRDGRRAAGAPVAMPSSRALTRAAFGASPKRLAAGRLAGRVSSAPRGRSGAARGAARQWAGRAAGAKRGWSGDRGLVVAASNCERRERVAAWRLRVWLQVRPREA